MIELYAGFANNPGDNVAHFAHFTWSELYLWPEETGEDITFMLPVAEAEEAELLIRAYNTYELRTEAVKK